MMPERHLIARVVVVAVLLLTMAVAFVSHSALRSFEVELRPELIGGIRVIVGDEVLDASVKARLDHMKVALTA